MPHDDPDRYMLIKLLGITAMLMLFASFLLGLTAPLFAKRATIWKALGVWGLGLGTGLSGIALSFMILRLQGAERAALIAAGKSVPINDMPGYGQAMIGALGLLYFAVMFGFILLGFTLSFFIVDKNDGSVR